LEPHEATDTHEWNATPTEQLFGDLAALREELLARTGALRETVAGFVDERPLATVAIAFAVGWLLSGALVSRTTGRFLKLGTRLFLGSLVKQAIAAGGLGALAAMVPERRKPATP